MADAGEKNNKVIKLKKRISEELNEIDKDLKDMEKSKKESVEKIEIKKVELKKFTSTQAVCDEHYATLQEIEQASKLIEERKTSITALDTTIANLDLQISQIQSEHDKAVAELEKKRRRLNDYLKYYEDLNDKLEKLIELLGEEEKKHCIELNNLKVERAKTLARTDLSEEALNKVLKDLDNKMVDLNKEHGKLIDSISQKLSEITVDASEVEDLLSKEKKKAPAKKKPKPAGEAGEAVTSTEEDDTEEAIGDEASEVVEVIDEVTGLPTPGKAPAKAAAKAPGKAPAKAAAKADRAEPGEAPSEAAAEMVEEETDEDVEELDEEKKAEKEQRKKERKEKKEKEKAAKKEEAEGEEAETEEEGDDGKKGRVEKPKVAATKSKESKKDFKTKFSLSMPKQQFLPKGAFKDDQDDYPVDEEQEKEEVEYDSDYRPAEVGDSEAPAKGKKKAKKKTPEAPKKPKKKKAKKKDTGEDEYAEEEEEEDESLDEELLDWFASREKDIRSDLLRQGMQITPSNRIITKDDRVITLKQAQRLGLLHDMYEEGEGEEEEESESFVRDEFGIPRPKKKKGRDKQVKYYKSPASSASSLGKESSESHICGRDMEYLKVVFGKSLTIALAEITAVQPTDPIHYLAHWMLKYRYNQEIEQITRIQIQELMIEQERLAAEKWHRELQEEARLAVLEALFRAENIIIQQDFQSELQLREYEGEFEGETPVKV